MNNTNDMNKAEILKELQMLYYYMTQDPKEWAQHETERMLKKGYDIELETKDFYIHYLGYAEGTIEYILTKCGVEMTRGDER